MLIQFSEAYIFMQIRYIILLILTSHIHLPLCFNISIDNFHVSAPARHNPSRDSISYDWYGASTKEPLMLICIIIIHVSELKLLPLMFYSVKICVVLFISMISINYIII